MDTLDAALQADLDDRRAQGLYRRRRVIDSAQAVHCVVDGQSVVSFCSNDYLGLANHPELRQAVVQAVDKYGVGSGSAHLVNGHSRLHEDCEQRLAAFTGRARALLFSTGYMANLAITSALVDRGDEIIQDKLNHASLIDAAQLSQARLRRYRHNDVPRLEHLLSSPDRSYGRRLIMVDGVFSMDGDRAPLASISKLASQYSAWLMVDDAHGFGVLGPNGAGLCEEMGLSDVDVPILMATLGKALGVAGAFVAGSENLIETLVQKSRSYVYTTASPPAMAAATLCSLDMLEREAWRRERLHELIAYFRQRAASLGIDLMESSTAIQPVLIGDNHQAVAISEALFKAGSHVVAIRPPTVPTGTARLRITLSAAHQQQDIDHLLETLAVLMQDKSAA